MRRIASAGVTLPVGRSFTEWEQDREWVLQLLKRMKVHRFREEDFEITFKIDVDTPGFALWLETLQQRGDLIPHHIWVGHRYTVEELLSAPLLDWEPVSVYVDERGPYRRCVGCGAKLEQTSDLVVDERRLRRRELVRTTRFEILLTASLAARLQAAGFTGFRLRPVWSPSGSGQGEPRLYQLVVTNVLPPMASPPTAFEEPQRCEVCGREAKFLQHEYLLGQLPYYELSDVYYAPDALQGVADFNLTAEQIGTLPYGSPLLLITPRVYAWLCEQGVPSARVKPVYWVGEAVAPSEGRERSSVKIDGEPAAQVIRYLYDRGMFREIRPAGEWEQILGSGLQ